MYTGASAMLAEQVRTDVLANNLSNVQTVGFKRDTVVQSAFPDMMIRRIYDPVRVGDGAAYDPRPQIGRLGTGTYVEGTWAVQEDGPLQFTDNPFDLALVGPGFFAVETEAGVRFTRDGRFSLDADGWLVTQNGSRVLGADGAVFIGEGEHVAFDEAGQVWVDGVVVGTIQVWDFPEAQWLQKEGATMLAMTDEAGEPEVVATPMQSGYVEQSNVNVVSAMVGLIGAFRAYEANQRVIQTYDETLGKAVNELGRV